MVPRLGLHCAALLVARPHRGPWPEHYSGGPSTLTTVETIKPVKPTLTLWVLAITFIALAGTVLALTIPVVPDQLLVVPHVIHTP